MPIGVRPVLTIYKAELYFSKNPNLWYDTVPLKSTLYMIYTYTLLHICSNSDHLMINSALVINFLFHGFIFSIYSILFRQKYEDSEALKAEEKKNYSYTKCQHICCVKFLQNNFLAPDIRLASCSAYHCVRKTLSITV